MEQVKAFLQKYGAFIAVPGVLLIALVKESRDKEERRRRTEKARRTRIRNQRNQKPSTTKKSRRSSKNGLISFAKYKRIKAKSPSQRTKQEKKDFFLYNMNKGRKKAKK